MSVRTCGGHEWSMLDADVLGAMCVCSGAQLVVWTQVTH